MIRGNKGEWSEVYALFKLLGDKKLSLGKSDTEKLKEFVYPIIKIIRTESKKIFEYSIQDKIIVISGGKKVLNIPISKFKEKAVFLLNFIKENRERTFTVPKIEQFMHYINCISLKAKSSTKTDITIVVHDQRTNQQPKLGFSIKSQLGTPSTLLNAGKTTNFIYKIVNANLSKKEVKQINSSTTKSKIMDRVVKIKNKGGKLKFVKTEKNIFSNNLILIDSLLPEILAQIILNFYSSKTSHLTDLVHKVASENPLNYDTENKHKFYEYKVKRFLTDTALGMMPSKVWAGKYDATGGYLIVKENGDILCYHIYNRNKFENYLLDNTKLDTASSTRHKFGQIYEKNGELFFNLNLQIRFIK